MDGTTWLIVCTQKRILLLDHGFLFGFKQSEMNLENINSISYQTGLLFGSIEIWHSGARMLIENCNKKTVKPFVEAVNAAMTAAKGARTASVTNTAIPAAPAADDMVSQLERLGALVEKGLLSKEEFEAQKKKLLGL